MKFEEQGKLTQGGKKIGHWLSLWGGGGDWLGKNTRECSGFEKNVLYLNWVGYTGMHLSQVREYT